MVMRKNGRGGIRAVSLLAAFALVLAHLVGGYAHAAGHGHAKAAETCGHSHAVSTSAAASTVGPAVMSGARADCDQAINHSDACDFMCNGGIAILVATIAVAAAPKDAGSSAVAAITRLLLPPSLDRPPRPSTSA
jgi:hypothetical protein